VSTEDHCYFLTVYNKSLLLKVGFEDSVGAAQRKAHIVTELFAFTGEFAACCHDFMLPLIFYNLYQCTLFRHFCQSVNGEEGAIMVQDE
jgi:hypothetical protein